MATDRAMEAGPPPTNSAAMRGRYMAIAKSSRTSTESTEEVSGFDKRPNSASTLAITPEEEM